MYRKILPFLFLSLLASCAQPQEKEAECDFTAADFEIVAMPIDGAEQIPTGDAEFGRVGRMLIVNDSVLALSESRGKRLLWLIDHKNNTAANVLRRGEGPEELTELTTLTCQDGQLYAAGLNDGKILRFDLAADTLGLRYVSGAKVPYQPLRSMMTDSTTVFSLSPAFTGHRYSLYNTADSTVQYIDAFPIDSIRLEAKPDNAFMQAEISLTPDGKTVVVANRTWPVIEIMDAVSHDVKYIQGPVPSDAKVVKEEFGGGYTYAQRPASYVWECLDVTDKSIYAGYNGYVRTDDAPDDDDAVTSVCTFDLQGNPQKLYTFDLPILCFTVDETNGVIYVVHDEEEPRIVEYVMK